jgi:hypothetical protein
MLRHFFRTLALNAMHLYLSEAEDLKSAVPEPDPHWVRILKK